MRVLHCKLDGQEPIDALLGLIVEWTFVARGEWSESPFHQGDIAYYLGSSADARVYVLSLNELAERGEEDDSVFVTNVAAAVDAAGEDVRHVVNELIAATRLNDGHHVDYTEIGDFDLD